MNLIMLAKTRKLVQYANRSTCKMVFKVSNQTLPKLLKILVLLGASKLTKTQIVSLQNESIL